jgi:hypothetical protein
MVPQDIKRDIRQFNDHEVRPSFTATHPCPPPCTADMIWSHKKNDTGCGWGQLLVTIGKATSVPVPPTLRANFADEKNGIMMEGKAKRRARTKRARTPAPPPPPTEEADDDDAERNTKLKVCASLQTSPPESGCIPRRQEV